MPVNRLPFSLAIGKRVQLMAKCTRINRRVGLGRPPIRDCILWAIHFFDPEFVFHLLPPNEFFIAWNSWRSCSDIARRQVLLSHAQVS